MVKESAIGFGAPDPAGDHQHHPYAAVIDPEYWHASLSIKLEARMLPGNAVRRGLHTVPFDPIKLRRREPG